MPDESQLDQVIATMEQQLDTLRSRGDARRHFHRTYLRTTRSVRAALVSEWFQDPAWVERWTVSFARLYLRALEPLRRPVPPVWASAFAAAGLAPWQLVLLGMNAHINHDLPLALLDVIDDTEFGDPGVLKQRGRDHQAIDRVLTVQAEVELRHRQPVLTQAAVPLTVYRIREARALVWSNAQVLHRARRDDPAAYRAGRAELERLTLRRAADIVSRRGRLTLLAQGFGVRLPDNPDHPESPAALPTATTGAAL